MSILDYLYDRQDIRPLDQVEHDIFWGEIISCNMCGQNYMIAADEINKYGAYCRICMDTGRYAYSIVSLEYKRKLQALIQGATRDEWPVL